MAINDPQLRFGRLFSDSTNDSTNDDTNDVLYLENGATAATAAPLIFFGGITAGMCSHVTTVTSKLSHTLLR